MLQRRSRVAMQQRASQDGWLAAVVVARREQLGLQQRELAQVAGCSSRSVHAVEGGSNTVRLDTLTSILEALGLHLEVHRGAAANVGADPDLVAHLERARA